MPDARRNRCEERVAKLESRRADAWLERRLRVFEHTLTDLQKRQETGGTQQRRARPACSNRRWPK